MNVADLLQDRKISFMPKGADFEISCLNSEHEDKNPSMRVDQITGIFHCFSCKFKGNLFYHFGERANQFQQRKELFKKKLIRKRSESVGVSFLRIHYRISVIGEVLNLKLTKSLRRFTILEWIM